MKRIVNIIKLSKRLFNSKQELNTICTNNLSKNLIMNITKKQVGILEDEKSNSNVTTIDKNYKAEVVNKYNKSFDQHYTSEFPYVDLTMYKELLENIDKVESFIDTRNGLLILSDLITYQYEILLGKHLEFTIQMLFKISQKECGSFKMYYCLEEEFLKNIANTSSEFIVRIAFCFALGNQGSILLFNRVAEELLKRKVSTLQKDDFILLYNTMSVAKLNNKLFWLIVNKANEEKYKVDSSVLIPVKEH